VHWNDCKLWGISQKARLSLPHTEGIWESNVIAALILDLDTPGKKPVYPFSRRLGVPHIRSGRFGQRMNGNLKTCWK